MAVKIRLQRRGRKKKPFYHIVVADARAPRGGRFIEKIGTYNPLTKPATIELDRDRAFTWLMEGAQPTDTARAILRFKGVMFRKHLQRGVLKGALTQEEADTRYEKWIAEKDARIDARAEKAREEEAARIATIAGVGMEVPKAEEEEVVAEGAEEVSAEEATAEVSAEEAKEETPGAEEAEEEAPAVAETKEEAPVAEEAKEEAPEAEEAKEEAPAAEEGSEEEEKND